MAVMAAQPGTPLLECLMDNIEAHANKTLNVRLLADPPCSLYFVRSEFWVISLLKLVLSSHVGEM